MAEHIIRAGGRLLRQHGFDARQLPGRFETFKTLGRTT